MSEQTKTPGPLTFRSASAELFDGDGEFVGSIHPCSGGLLEVMDLVEKRSAALAHAAHATQVHDELVTLARSSRAFVERVSKIVPGECDDLLMTIDETIHRAIHGKPF